MCTRCISFINMVRLVRITRRMHSDVVISLRNEQYKGVLHHYFRRINQYPSLSAVRDAIFHELLIMRIQYVCMYVCMYVVLMYDV